MNHSGSSIYVTEKGNLTCYRKSSIHKIGFPLEIFDITENFSIIVFYAKNLGRKKIQKNLRFSQPEFQVLSIQ